MHSVVPAALIAGINNSPLSVTLIAIGVGARGRLASATGISTSTYLRTYMHTPRILAGATIGRTNYRRT